MKETPARVYGDTLVYHKQGATIQVQVGMPDWYRWLETVSSFAFQGEQGSFTASKDHSDSKRGGHYRCIRPTLSNTSPIQEQRKCQNGQSRVNSDSKGL